MTVRDFLRKLKVMTTTKIAERSPQGAACASLLRDLDISPVLADVGASGGSPKVWQPIAAQSTLVGFEPDSRNPDGAFGIGYARAVLIGKAVSPDRDAETVSFVLTKYPSCSSMLEPDLDALESFSFRDYFQPVGRAEVPATSLSRAIDSEKLGALHWIKLDTQGADLRLLKGLEPRHLGRVLAVDIEPGLIKAYVGEDLFTHCHAWLIEDGFWMSRLEYQSYPKIRPETLADLARLTGRDEKLLMRQLPKAPTAVEGRYLREVAWLRKNAEGPEAFVLAGVFGLLDGQQGYTFDVAAAYAERFGEDDRFIALRKAAVDTLG